MRRKSRKKLLQISVLFLLAMLALGTAVFAEDAPGSYSLVIQKILAEGAPDAAKNRDYTFHIEGYTRSGGERRLVERDVTINPNDREKKTVTFDGPTDITVVELTNQAGDDITDADGNEWEMSTVQCESSMWVSGRSSTISISKPNGMIRVKRPEPKEGEIMSNVFFRVSGVQGDGTDAVYDSGNVEIASGGEQVFDHLPAGIYTVEELTAEGFDITVGPRTEDIAAGEDGTVHINGNSGSVTITAPSVESVGVPIIHHYNIYRGSYLEREVDVRSGESYKLEHLPKGDYTVEVSRTYQGAGGGYTLTAPKKESKNKTATLSFEAGRNYWYSVSGDVIDGVTCGPLKNANNKNLLDTDTYKIKFGTLKADDTSIISYLTSNALKGSKRSSFSNSIIPVEGRLYFSVRELSNQSAKKISLAWTEHTYITDTKSCSKADVTYNITVDPDRNGESWITISKPDDSGDPNHRATYEYTVADAKGRVQTVSLTAGTDKRIEIQNPGNCKVKEKVIEVPKKPFSITVEDDVKSVTSAESTFDITIYDTRQLTIQKPAGSDGGRSYQFAVVKMEEGGEKEVKTVTLQAGEKDESLMLTEGSYQVRALDDKNAGFQMTYNDSSTVGVYGGSNAQVTFTNTFEKEKGAYRIIHEYYLENPDGSYTPEGTSLVSTVGGLAINHSKTYSDQNVTKEYLHNYNNNSYHYTYFESEYGMVVEENQKNGRLDAARAGALESPGPSGSPEASVSPEPSGELISPEPEESPEVSETPEALYPAETPEPSEDPESPEPLESSAPEETPELSEPTLPSDPDQDPETPKPLETPDSLPDPDPANTDEPTVGGGQTEKEYTAETELSALSGRPGIPILKIFFRNQDTPKDLLKAEQTGDLNLIQEPEPTESRDDPDQAVPSVPTPEPEPVETSAPAAEPEAPVITPDATEEPEPTDMPEATPEPEPAETETPEEEKDPAGTATPGGGQEMSESPEPSGTPGSTESPVPTVTPSPSETPTPSMSPTPSESPMNSRMMKAGYSVPDDAKTGTGPKGEEYKYWVEEGKGNVTATEDGSQIIILRYYRKPEVPGTGSYKVIHVYYLRDKDGDHLEGTSEIRTVDAGELTPENHGILYTVDGSCRKDENGDLVPAGGSPVERETNPTNFSVNGEYHTYTYDNPAYGIIEDSDYTADTKMQGAYATEEGNQIIILRYYRTLSGDNIREGSYHIVHEYYFREKQEDSPEAGEGEEAVNGGSSRSVPLGPGEDTGDSSFAGTLESNDGYAYTFEGMREIERRTAPLNETFKAEGVKWELNYTHGGVESVYTHYNDGYGLLDDADDEYEAIAGKSLVTATEAGNEVIILRYVRGTDVPTDPDKPGPEDPKDPDKSPDPGGPGDPDRTPDPEIPENPDKTPDPVPTKTPDGTPQPTASMVPDGTPLPTVSVVPGGTPQPSASIVPGATPAPAATGIPGSTPTSGRTRKPAVTPTPRATGEPGQTPVSSPSGNPNSSPGPEVTEDPNSTPGPDETPDPDRTPAPDHTPVPGGTPEPGSSPEPGNGEDPDNPGYPTELPDPNDPDSPDRIIIWEEGVPRAYVRMWDPEKETYVYILEEDVPLGWGSTPDTADMGMMPLWLTMALGSMGGITALRPRKKKRRSEFEKD